MTLILGLIFQGWSIWAAVTKSDRSIDRYSVQQRGRKLLAPVASLHHHYINNYNQVPHSLHIDICQSWTDNTILSKSFWHYDLYPKRKGYRLVVLKQDQRIFRRLVYQLDIKGKYLYNPIPLERMSTMSKKTQYQPIGGNGDEPSAAQEVIYAKEFKKADIAGGYRKPKVKEAKKENPNLQR